MLPIRVSKQSSGRGRSCRGHVVESLVKGQFLKVRRLRGGAMGYQFDGRAKDHAGEKVVINTDRDRAGNSKNTWNGKKGVYDIAYVYIVNMFVGEGGGGGGGRL
jgi:hypothetical protein